MGAMFRRMTDHAPGDLAWFGDRPVPAAEKALETGKADELTALMAEQVTHGIADRFKQAAAHRSADSRSRSSDTAA